MRETEAGDLDPSRSPQSEGEWAVSEPLPHDGHTVWCVAVELDAARRANCASLLSDHERGRADRFLRTQDRDRFLASHAALRIILGGTLRVEPKTLAFAVSSTGRPTLAGWKTPPLDVNLSHSGGHALVAVSTTARIGVDIEQHRPLPDALRIARAHFHPHEIAALEAAGPTREAAFFAAWTAKEAFVKAIGTGLSMPLDGFAVSVPPAPPALLEATGLSIDDWTVIGLVPAPGTTGAVAIEAPRASCRQVRLRADWADRPIA